MSYLLVFLGASLLYVGGELLVRNASQLARSFGLSSLVIGLTVVAFGTSSPELAATLVSTLSGAPEVAIGNVVGSNIANIGLILGLTALIYPLQGARAFVRRELPLMIGAGLLLFPLFWSGLISRLEGALLLALLTGYLWFQFRQADRDAGSLVDAGAVVSPGPAAELPTAAQLPIWRAVLGAGLGVVLLVVGAQALVTGAVTIAQGFGVPERVIGLTLVALGTSLPELASSLVAALRREADLILGNIIGSNIFNVLAILGVTALVQPIPVDFASVTLDLWVMTGLSLLVLPFMLRRYRLGRVAGGLLLVLYGGYIGFLYL